MIHIMDMKIDEGDTHTITMINMAMVVTMITIVVLLEILIMMIMAAEIHIITEVEGVVEMSTAAV